MRTDSHRDGSTIFLAQKTTPILKNRALVILKTKAELSRLNKLTRKALNTDVAIKEPLAIVVDKMGETLNIDEKDILPNVTQEKKEFISGLIQQKNQFIILAIEQLIKRL